MPLLTKKEFAQLIGIQEKHLPVYYEPPRNKFAYVDTAKGKEARIDTDVAINASFVYERAVKLAKEGKEILINGIPVIPLGKTELPPQIESVKPKKVQTPAKAPKAIVLPPIEAKQPYFQQTPAPTPDFDVNESAIRQKKTMQVEIPTQTLGTTVNLQINNKNENNANFFELDLEKKQKDIDIATEVIIEKKLKNAHRSGETILTDIALTIINEGFRSLALKFRDGMERELKINSAMSGWGVDEVSKRRKDITDSVNKAYEDGLKEAKDKIINNINENATKRGVGERA